MKSVARFVVQGTVQGIFFRQFDVVCEDRLAAQNCFAILNTKIPEVNFVISNFGGEK